MWATHQQRKRTLSSLMGNVEQVADGLVAGFYARLAALKSVPAEVDSLQASFAAAGTSFTMLFLQIVLVVAVVARHVRAGRPVVQADAGLGERVAQVLCARDSSRPGGGDRLHRGAAARRRRPAAQNAAALGRRGRRRADHSRGPADGADGLAADPISGTLGPYEGSHPRPVAGVRLGHHRRHRRCDVAALERRAGTRRPDPNGFWRPDLPPACVAWYGGTDAPWRPPLPVRAREAAGEPALPNCGRRSSSPSSSSRF